MRRVPEQAVLHEYTDRGFRGRPGHLVAPGHVYFRDAITRFPPTIHDLGSQGRDKGVGDAHGTQGRRVGVAEHCTHTTANPNAAPPMAVRLSEQLPGKIITTSGGCAHTSPPSSSVTGSASCPSTS